MIKSSIKILLIIFFFQNSLFAKSEYLQEGIILFNKNKLEDAKFKFEKDLVFNPKSESSYLYLSKIFNKQDKKKLEELKITSQQKAAELIKREQELATLKKKLPALEIKAQGYKDMASKVNALLEVVRQKDTAIAEQRELLREVNAKKQEYKTRIIFLCKMRAQELHLYSIV